jgi:hypothetical protein
MSAMGRCSCGGALHMAEGGSVREEDYRPAFRTPMIAKRREDRQDRKGAKDAPLSVARGLVAGSLGIPGDLEKMVRELYNIKSPRGAKGLPDVDSLPFFRTSEDWNEALPLRAAPSKSRAAMEGFGNIVAPMPTTAAIKGAKYVAPALEKVAEKIAANAEPVVAGRRGAAKYQTGAVKLPGGNWMNTPDAQGPKQAAANIMADMPADADKRVVDWGNRVFPKYLQNELGTAQDPLIEKFYAHRGHIPTGELQSNVWGQFPGEADSFVDPMGATVGRDVFNRRMENVAYDDNWLNAKKRQHLAYPADSTHYELMEQAGGDAALAPQGISWSVKTPWEHLSDAAIDRTSISMLPDEVKAANPWMTKEGVDPSTIVHSFPEKGSYGTGEADINDLQLHRLPRYMDQAVKRFETMAAEKKARAIEDAAYAKDEPYNGPFQGPLSLQERYARANNVVLNPKDIPNTGIGTIAELAGRGAAAQDEAMQHLWSLRGNKTFRSYEDVPNAPEGMMGMNWQELNPNLSMGPEGYRQNLCIGSECYGHPQKVREGDERAFSLRNRAGDVYATASMQRIHPLEAFVSLPEDTQKAYLKRALGADAPDFRDLSEAELNTLEQSIKADPDYKAKHQQQWYVGEIKGKHNAAPADEVHPYLRDFINTMPHSEYAGDIDNAGYALSAHGRYWRPGELESVARDYGTVTDPVTNRPLNWHDFDRQQRDFGSHDTDENFRAFMKVVEEDPSSSQLNLPEDFSHPSDNLIFNKNPEDFRKGGRVRRR